MRSEPALRILHVDRVPASASLGMLRLHGEWIEARVPVTLELVGGAVRLDPLPEPPSAEATTDFKAAFALPIERLDDLGSTWSLESPTGARVDVEWPAAEHATPHGGADAAASVAEAAAEALIKARAQGQELVRQKEAEIARLRADLHEAVSILTEADGKIDAAQQASTAMSRRLRQAEGDAEEARQMLRALEVAADEPHVALARERERVAELEAALAMGQARHEGLEGEIRSTVAKLDAALEATRLAEGAATASQAALADALTADRPSGTDQSTPADGERIEQLERDLQGRDAREAAQRAAIATLEDELHAARAELDAARAGVEEMLAAHETLAAELDEHARERGAGCRAAPDDCGPRLRAGVCP